MQIYDEITAFLASDLGTKGLAFFGVVALRPEPEFSRFEAWLGEGRHAGMEYLERHRAVRRDPRELLAGAQSAIVYGLPYYQGDKAPTRRYAGAPRIAQYARLRDYHKVLRERGEAVLATLTSKLDLVGRVVVDSAPILERALAARTGAGFVGKNTCFIDAERGSFYLLAEILTTLPVESLGGVADAQPIDPAARSRQGGCGSCRRCQVHCPTGALDQDYRLDANRCLAYWTIEHRGTIPEKFWPWLKIYYFGCDICQLVCPYNRNASTSASGALRRLEVQPALFDVATMSQSAYEQLFGGTPMTRAKREGLMRNALIAMTVTSDPRLDDAIGIIGEHGAPEVVRATIQQIERYRAN